MSKICEPRCDAHGKKVQKFVHKKLGTTHVLSGPENMEGLIPAMFKATADYAADDRFLVNSEDYTLVPQDGQELRSSFFKKGASVSVLVDVEGKCLAFSSGNGAKKLPAAAAGHILVGGADGDPADSGKTVNDFDAAGSAQAVEDKLDQHKVDRVAHITASERESWNAKAEQSELARHVENTTVHVATEERQLWNNKADRAVGAAAGNLAALDAQGNPVDSGLAPEDINARVPNPTEGNLVGMDATGKLTNSDIAAGDVLLTSDLAAHNTAEDAHPDIKAALSNKAEKNLIVKELIAPGANPIIPANQGCFYTKDQFGRTSIRIHVDLTNTNVLPAVINLGMLPAGFRPKFRIVIPVAMWGYSSGSMVGTMFIENSGALLVREPSPKPTGISATVALSATCSFYSY